MLDAKLSKPPRRSQKNKTLLKNAGQMECNKSAIVPKQIRIAALDRHVYALRYITLCCIFVLLE